MLTRMGDSAVLNIGLYRELCVKGQIQCQRADLLIKPFIRMLTSSGQIIYATPRHATPTMISDILELDIGDLIFCEKTRGSREREKNIEEEL